jgi:cellulose synthase/poly-beta-1,6-N-acetylglucosamine synthase-like glycosyltransferase
MIFTIISLLLFSSYAVLIAAISAGWLRLKECNTTTTPKKIKISVIVAARNEAVNIETLLNSLLRQDYPKDLFEIFIVDDHSTDQTLNLAERFITQMRGLKNVKIISLKENEEWGKKAAIQSGIMVSEGELIVITDADCVAGKSWLTTLASFYVKQHPQMILGPVSMTNNGSFFGKLQSLEFTSLIATAAGSCRAGFPLLANGANIAFTRQAYESCGGFTGNLQYPSGDDMFLMLNIKRKSGAGAIRFLRSEEAIVYTPAATEFKSFFQQRLRWVSKSRGYTDPVVILTSLAVFLVNAWLVITASVAPFSKEHLQLFIILFLLKILIDLPIMLVFSRFQRSRPLMWLFPLMELLNAVYTLVIGIAGNTGKYQWKGRKVSTYSREIYTNSKKQKPG